MDHCLNQVWNHISLFLKYHQIQTNQYFSAKILPQTNYNQNFSKLVCISHSYCQNDYNSLSYLNDPFKSINILYISVDMEGDFLFNKSVFIKTSQQNILNHYDFSPKQLGRGAYGVVYKARQRNSQNQNRAVKKIPRKLIKYPDILLNEIEILKQLDHPNTVRLYEIFEDKNNIYLVTDLCQGGELFDRLDSLGSFSQANAQKIFRQIVDALKYCHKQKICHRDLKPQNFLFLTPQSLDMKLIDFGLAFKWANNMQEQLIAKKQNKLVGTAYYIAPEVIKGRYNQTCDIWSAGVILYILVTGVPPFDGQDDKEIIQCVKKQKYTFQIPQMQKVSNQLKDLISKLLVPQDKRLTLDQIYKHPWMCAQASPEPLLINFKQMSNFSKSSKLKKITTTFIATQLSQKEISQLVDLFKQLDTNHDGQISLEQLKQGLNKQQQSVSLMELKKFMEEVDTDHNGKLNYTEFLACTIDKSLSNSEQYLRRMFKKLDKDGNGTVERQQLAELLQCEGTYKLNGKQIDQLIETCDVNGDGKIDLGEFLSAMKK